MTGRHPARRAPVRSSGSGAAAAPIATSGARRRGALLLAAAATAATLALAGCGDNEQVLAEEERPARVGGDSAATNVGEAEPGGGPPGVTRQPTGTSPTPLGAAGSGPAAPASDWTGSIWQPGSGRMSDGDPTDAQVRGVLALLDRGEIDAARLAQTKARDAQVRQYAATMVQAHERSLAQVGTGTRGTAGDLVTPVVEMQQKTLQRMQTLAAGPDFDRDFMARQMEAHEGTLQMLDRLEQSARSTALVGQIRQRKRDVEHHIEQTRAILNVVSRPPVGMSDPGLAAPRGGFYYSESAQPGAAGGAARAGAQPVTPANTRTGAPTAVAPGADAQGAARNPASSVPATQSPRTTPATTPSP